MNKKTITYVLLSSTTTSSSTTSSTTSTSSTTTSSSTTSSTTTTLPTGQCSGSQPPAFGSWNINEYTVCIDESIQLASDSIIVIADGQTLMLDNTQVNQQGHRILFMGGSVLRLENATVTFK